MNKQQERREWGWLQWASFTSFRGRMTVMFVGIALVPMLFSTIFSSLYLKNVVTDEVHAKERSIVEANVAAIDYAIQRNASMLREMQNFDEIKSGNEQEIMKTLKKFEQANKDIEQFVYVNKDDMALTSSGQKISVTDRDYAKQARQTKQTTYSDLLISKSTGRNVVIIFVPILDAQQAYAGGIFCAMTTDNLNVFTKTIRIGETGYGYLISPSGMLLTHPEESKAGKNIADVLEPAEAEKLKAATAGAKDGLLDVKGNDGQTREISYAVVPSTGWFLVTNVVNSEVFSAVATANRAAIWLGVITAIVATLIAVFFSRSTTKPILAITGAVSRMAEGDLSPRLDVTRSDELGQLAANMNQMLESFSDIVGKASLTAEQLGASSEELTAAAAESVQTSHRIADAIGVVFQASDSQLQGAEQTSIAMGEMAAGVQRIAESSSVVTEASQMSMSEVQRGRVAIDQAVGQMKLIHESVGESAEQLRALEKYSQQIGDIVSVITDITNQTQLLSLNASIEAARAGEQGRGFAVVANEVKKLAEQSSASAQHISDLIREVQASTLHAVQAMGKGVQDVAKGSNLIDDAGQVFNRIAASFQEISDQIQEVSAAAEEMSAGTQEVSASMSEIVYMTKTSHEQGQGVSKGSAKQLSAMEEISASAEDLSHMAQELQESLAKFKTR